VSSVVVSSVCANADLKRLIEIELESAVESGKTDGLRIKPNTKTESKKNVLNLRFISTNQHIIMHLIFTTNFHFWEIFRPSKIRLHIGV